MVKNNFRKTPLSGPHFGVPSECPHCFAILLTSIPNSFPAIGPLQIVSSPFLAELKLLNKKKN